MIDQRRPANHRPITDADIEDATRALRLKHRDSAHLRETLECHRGLNAFASAVIAKAVEVELDRRGK
jgi:hypothetical protein